MEKLAAVIENPVQGIGKLLPSTWKLVPSTGTLAPGFGPCLTSGARGRVT